MKKCLYCQRDSRMLQTGMLEAVAAATRVYLLIGLADHLKKYLQTNSTNSNVVQDKYCELSQPFLGPLIYTIGTFLLLKAIAFLKRTALIWYEALLGSKEALPFQTVCFIFIPFIPGVFACQLCCNKINNKKNKKGEKQKIVIFQAIEMFCSVFLYVLLPSNSGPALLPKTWKLCLDCPLSFEALHS